MSSSKPPDPKGTTGSFLCFYSKWCACHCLAVTFFHCATPRNVPDGERGRIMPVFAVGEPDILVGPSRRVQLGHVVADLLSTLRTALTLRAALRADLRQPARADVISRSQFGPHGHQLRSALCRSVEMVPYLGRGVCHSGINCFDGMCACRSFFLINV
jgi:hypothetical protein